MRSADCLKNTALDYESLWKAKEPNLPWDEISLMLVSIITSYPEVLSIANDPRLASKSMLAIDFRTAPPGLDSGKVLGIMNTGLIYIKARCPELAGELPSPEFTQNYLLNWPRF